MLALQIFDSLGNMLHPGDMLQIQYSANIPLGFYSRLQVKNGVLFPFCHFTHDRVVKVAELPEGLSHVEETPTMVEYWINPKTELLLVEKGILDKWKLDNVTFNLSSFYKVVEADLTGATFKPSTKDTPLIARIAERLEAKLRDKKKSGAKFITDDDIDRMFEEIHDLKTTEDHG